MIDKNRTGRVQELCIRKFCADNNKKENPRESKTCIRVLRVSMGKRVTSTDVPAHAPETIEITNVGSFGGIVQSHVSY